MVVDTIVLFSIRSCNDSFSVLAAEDKGGFDFGLIRKGEEAFTVLQIVLPHAVIDAPISVSVLALTVFQAFDEVPSVARPILVFERSESGLAPCHGIYGTFIHRTTFLHLFEDSDSGVPDARPLVRHISLGKTMVQIDNNNVRIRLLHHL
jgi:hypothetical protein